MAVCPACLNPTGRHAWTFLCDGCLAGWSIKDEIPTLNDGLVMCSMSGPLEHGELGQLVASAESNGWQQALYEYNSVKVARGAAPEEDQRLADWQYLVPLDRNTVVLVVGSGLGTVPLSFSERVAAVYVVDPVWERVRFLRIRAVQQGIQNVFPFYTGGRFSLPFGAGSFHLVVLKSSVPWGAVDDTPRNQRETSQIILKQVHFLLRPGGKLSLVVGNGLSFLRLLSLIIRPAMWIPRSIEALKSALGLGQKVHLGSLIGESSLLGYRKLLRAGGFTDLDVYAPLPSHTGVPLFSLPLNSGPARRHFFSHIFPLFEMVSPEVKRQYGLQYPIARLGVKLALRFRLTAMVKYFVPGYSIIATKKPGVGSVQEC